MVNKEFRNVLFIGPDYKNHRGGIGAVLSIYASNIDGFKFIPSFKAVGAIRKIAVFITSIFKLSAKLIFDKELEIIHVHGSHGASVYRKAAIIFMAKLLFSKKVIYHLHSSSFDLYYKNGNKLYRWLCNAAISRSDVLVALSNDWAKYYTDTFDPKRIVIIKNVIATPVKTNVRNNDLRLKFLFLGRIGERKGTFDLLEVIKMNKEVWNGTIKFLIGGDGETHKLVKLITEYQIDDIVTFIGWVSGDKKIHLLQTSDVLILPSYNEGLPISILEGMSYGLPIIASNVGGIPEVVFPDVNGYIVTPGNLKEIEVAVNSIISANPEQLVNYKNNSLSIAEDYMPQKVIQQLAELYQTL